MYSGRSILELLCHVFWSQVEYKIVCFISFSHSITFSESSYHYLLNLVPWKSEFPVVFSNVIGQVSENFFILVGLK